MTVLIATIPNAQVAVTVAQSAEDEVGWPFLYGTCDPASLLSDAANPDRKDG